MSSTLLVSLALHGGILAALLLTRTGAPGVVEPEKPVTVELVMEERRGEAKPPAPAAPPVSPPFRTAEPPRTEPRRSEAPAETARGGEPAAVAAPPVPPLPPSSLPPARAPVEARAEAERETTKPPEVSEPAPPPSQPSPAETARAEPPPAPPPEPATPDAAPRPMPLSAAPAVVPRIDLSGTDSPSDALAQGDRVIPATASAVFHNRPPPYPEAAARRGERGTVIVVIHVSPDGRAEGVDVALSSGYALLDQAAREAVMAWRFLPAMRGGRPVTSELPMRFIFEGQ